MNYSAVFKLLAGILLAFSSLAQIFSREPWWFIQGVNLVFHEAGHVLFMFFGEFMHILGGSLLEVLIPVLVTVHFYRSQQFFSAAVTSAWLASALLSVSIYASDASERLLPLITNDATSHDWYYLLLRLHLLSYDDLVGYGFTLCALLSVGLLAYFLSLDRDIRELGT